MLGRDGYTVLLVALSGARAVGGREVAALAGTTPIPGIKAGIALVGIVVFLTFTGSAPITSL